MAVPQLEVGTYLECHLLLCFYSDLLFSKSGSAPWSWSRPAVCNNLGSVHPEPHCVSSSLWIWPGFREGHSIPVSRWTRPSTLSSQLERSCWFTSRARDGIKWPQPAALVMPVACRPEETHPHNDGTIVAQWRAGFLYTGPALIRYSVDPHRPEGPRSVMMFTQQSDCLSWLTSMPSQSYFAQHCRRIGPTSYSCKPILLSWNRALNRATVSVWYGPTVGEIIAILAVSACQLRPVPLFMIRYAWRYCSWLSRLMYAPELLDSHWAW